jgi:TIR domain
MSDAAAEVFISYRRQEASWLAAWLHDRLVAQFGEARVFLDIDWIKPGVDFRQVIAEAIARSRVLLVIIGPRWLAAEGDGCRRLDRPDDPVRVELETAFRRGLQVIPLLLDGASMPPAADLPTSLAGLVRLNALQVGYQSARSDLARLVEALTDELGITSTRELPTAESAAKPSPKPGRTKSRRATPGDAERDEEQRVRLLRRLSRTYTEFLTQSVEHDALLKLQLDLDWLPGRTFRPQDRLLPIVRRQAEPLPAGAMLLQAFDETGGLDGDGLLVVGEAGQAARGQQ